MEPDTQECADGYDGCGGKPIGRVMAGIGLRWPDEPVVVFRVEPADSGRFRTPEPPDGKSRRPGVRNRCGLAVAGSCSTSMATSCWPRPCCPARRSD